MNFSGSNSLDWLRKVVLDKDLLKKSEIRVLDE